MARGGGGAEDGWRSPPGTHRSPTMHTTRSRSPFETTLQGVAGQLVERVAALPGNAGRPQLLRWLLAIGAIFVAGPMWRGLTSWVWFAFGTVLALSWSRLGLAHSCVGLVVKA